MEQRCELKKKHEKSTNLISIILIGSVYGLIVGGFLIKILGSEGNSISSVMIVVGLIGVVIAIVMRVTNEGDKLNQVKSTTIDKLNDIGFNVESSLINQGWTKSIKISEEESKIYYAYRQSAYDNFSVESFDFKDILDVSVTSNGNNQISVNKGGLIGGAAIGGALFGGFGAVVGAMSANKTSTEVVRDLSLIVTMNNLNDPIIKLSVIDGEMSTDSAKYQETVNILDEWFGKFTIIMKRNESI